MASMGLLDYYEAKIDGMCVGMNIRLENLPSDNLYEFRIVMGNDYTRSERMGADLITIDLKGIDVFEKQFFSLLKEAGYYIDYPEQTNKYIKNSPYMYFNEDDVINPHARMKVYIGSNEISGHAPEEEIQKILELLKKCQYVHNIRLVYSWKVYDISDDEYLRILEKAKPQIMKWAERYLEYGYSKSGIGDNFSRLFGILRISNHLSCDRIAPYYVNKITQDINIVNAKYVFKCVQCGSLIRKQRKCAFIYDYKSYKCPSCGGKYERIK